MQTLLKKGWLKMDFQKCRVFLPAMVLSAVIILSVHIEKSGAAEWIITPEMSVTGTYDDNLLFEDVSDYELRASPGLRANMTGERTRLEVAGKVDVLSYLDYSEFDRVNQDYTLQSEYDLNPRTTLKMGGRLRFDYTFETELEEAGIVSEKSRRSYYTFLPGISVALDERNSLALDLFYASTDNRRDERADSWSTGGDLVWSRMFLDEQTFFLAGAGVEHVDFESRRVEGTHDIYRGIVGVSRDMGERYNVLLRGGPTWTHSRFDRNDERRRDDDLGFFIDSRLLWQITERTSTDVGIDHGQYQSIYAENITRNRIRAGLRHRFTEKWSGNATGSFINSRTTGLVSREKRNTWQTGLSATYNLRPDMFFDLGYRYRHTRDRVDSTSKDGNRFFLQFTIRFPKQLN
ncbi:outer membrane beta-barrel protein [Desulfonatronospira thiodismutans]|nr:outer membrane beta-barrel protein [Desulfonatronospira thiodismutans]